MKICQVSFLRLSTPAERPYGSPGLGSKYQGQQGPTPSRAYEDFNNKKR
jgi:dCTP deaminase